MSNQAIYVGSVLGQQHSIPAPDIDTDFEAESPHLSISVLYTYLHRRSLLVHPEAAKELSSEHKATLQPKHVLSYLPGRPGASL